MQRTIAGLTLGMVLLSVAICTNGQQKTADEFVSVVGQFGIMLPTTIRDDFKPDILRMEDDKLVAWEYRWNLDSDQAAIIYAVGNVDMEAKADLYLERLRDNYAPGTIRNQKKTSFAGHPGLVSVIDSPNPIRKTSRAMIWVYVLKNRVYLMSLTLDNNATMEEHLKLMSTFRLLSPTEVETRVASMLAELTPEPLAQDPAPSRPTTDAQDAALKGRVKTVTTESEPYAGELLLGTRELASIENYDEHGNIVKTVEYRNSRPVRLRLYGTNKGERAFREKRRVWIDYKGRNNSVAREPYTEQRLYTIKYKHDPDGRLLEMRVLSDDGKEMETAKYNLKAKTVGRRYDPDYRAIRIPPFGFRSLMDMIIAANLTVNVNSKDIVSTLDANGNSVEDAYQVMNGSYSRPGFDGEKYYPIYRTDKLQHEYKLDDRGNWIQRKTVALTKDKQAVPLEVTYRTITYYQ